MRLTKVNSIALGLSLLAGAGATFGMLQAAAPIEGPGLKTMFEGLGYSVKELETTVGKEKYEITVKREDFTVPIAAEVSPSKSYVWLTVNLGPAKPADAATASGFRTLLTQNGSIQPVQFYITSKGLLMLGFPIDNRGITPLIMRARLDKIAADVAKSSTEWSPLIVK
jgi:hypothetical protein